MHFEEIAKQLGKTGLSIWPDFLSPESLREMRTDMDAIRETQAFRRAGTGQGKAKEMGDLVRRDEIYWLDRSSSNPVQATIWSKLDSLKEAFNRTLFLGISEFEGHYAAYPVGGFYRRHLDCFQADDSRVVSIALYLNEDWKAQDGGQLRVYGADSHTDVPPTGGTLVCFLSREKEHEVLSCNASRLSFTGWFKQREILRSRR